MLDYFVPAFIYSSSAPFERPLDPPNFKTLMEEYVALCTGMPSAVWFLGICPSYFIQIDDLHSYLLQTYQEKSCGELLSHWAVQLMHLKVK